jgi:hypothetical protein
MDFSNRNAQAQPAAPSAPATSAAGGAKKGRKNDNGKLTRIGIVAAVVALAVILIGVIVLATAGSNTKTEDEYVDNTKLQAVFLNTGQVYFGNVKTLNNKFFVVTNIYYLQTSNTAATGANANANANTSVSLVKLGCELHEPFDQMVINRDQVTFWENLQDNGQVAQAVKTFEKQNPNGQKCADQSSSSSTNSGNSVQSAGTNNGATNTTNNNTTTNP